MSKWISVKDELPRRGEKVLVYVPNIYGCDIDILGTAGFSIEAPVMYGKVTHWMPLPEPPKANQ